MSTETETVQTPIENELEVVIDPMVRQLSTMAELLDTLAKTSKSLTIEMKALTKDVSKLRLSKGGKKQKRVVNPDIPRKLGALEKPVPISEELAEFLGLTKGEMYSRQKVTQGVNKFIKDNDIQNPENRRYILLESEPGLKLKSLLRDPDQPLTFFNIQRYLKPHYPKVEPTETETTDTPKGKSVDVTDTPTDSVVVADSSVVTDSVVVADSSVVADDAVVDESVAPKKKVIRKVIKKPVQESA
uniref:DM2 domain-containing protein n=1 Tax=viral metagenome TaxID=1070528 RepID=A0A6C0LD12_9ZZZZ